MPERRKKVLISWSGGKDSAVALFELKAPDVEILGLFTVFVEPEKKAQMHEIPESLIQAQAAALDLPLYKVYVPQGATNEQWKSSVGKLLSTLKKEKGLEAVAFGDVNLKDIRKWREDVMQELGVEALFPIWEWSPKIMMNAFNGLGHQAIVHCLDPKRVPAHLLGKLYNSAFVEALPSQVDILGERGEFHSFVFDGPFFQFKVPVQAIGQFEKNGFMYQELMLKEGLSSGTGRRHN